MWRRRPGCGSRRADVVKARRAVGARYREDREHDEERGTCGDVPPAPSRRARPSGRRDARPVFSGDEPGSARRAGLLAGKFPGTSKAAAQTRATGNSNSDARAAYLRRFSGGGRPA